MIYYRKIENEEVTEIGSHSLILPSYGVEITEEEYNTLLAELEEKWKQEEPTDTELETIISEVANNGY